MYAWMYMCINIAGRLYALHTTNIEHFFDITNHASKHLEREVSRKRNVTLKLGGKIPFERDCSAPHLEVFLMQTFFGNLGVFIFDRYISESRVIDLWTEKKTAGRFRRLKKYLCLHFSPVSRWRLLLSETLKQFITWPLNMVRWYYSKRQYN